MVLIRAVPARAALLPCAALLALAACGESLFDAHGGNRDGGTDGGGDGGGDADVPERCPADTCIADAAADFDGTIGGTGGRWRYVEDARNRSWRQMDPDAGGMLGADPANKIRPCADDTSGACRELSGTLLLISGGALSDPALEHTHTGDGKVIQLAFRVHLPEGGAEQRVRLYRNSREDVLITATAMRGTDASGTITVDAIPGDRFLLALEPVGEGGPAAVRFFVIDAQMSFPSTCRLAVPFPTSPTSPTIENMCGAPLTSYNTGAEQPPTTAQPPFDEHGAAIYLESGFYASASTPLARGGPTTVQFWIQNSAPLIPETWALADTDRDNGGGLGVRFIGTFNPSGTQIEAVTFAGGQYRGPSASYTESARWHFVRVVHADGMVTLCLDGVRAASGEVPGPISTDVPMSLGADPSDPLSFFSGAIDDVRVLSTALPCD